MSATVLGGQEVSGVGRIEGPIVIVEGATNVSYDEVVEIRDSRGQIRRGRVLEVGEDMAVIRCLRAPPACRSMGPGFAF